MRQSNRHVLFSLFLPQTQLLEKALNFDVSSRSHQARRQHKWSLLFQRKLPPRSFRVQLTVNFICVDDDLYSANNLLSLYACSGVVSWTGVLSAYVRNGHYHVSLEFFDSTIVSGQCPQWVYALKCPKIMLIAGRVGLQDSNPYVCGRAWIHSRMINAGLEGDACAGVDVYTKCFLTS